MKTVILTFDYELFFGDRSGSVERSLLVPTQKILDTLEQVGGKAVFFVDYLMLKRMHSECVETQRDAFLIEEQLREIVRQGSRIELHLHPHWLNAKYLGNGNWDFSDFSHYTLDSLAEDVVTDLFIEGTSYLNEIARSIIREYRVSVFRAGGWAILPFSKLKEGFAKAGLYIDSSVCRGRFINGYTYSVDFRDSPRADIYRFSSNILKAEPDGIFTEVQIATFRFNPFTYVLNSMYRKINRRKLVCQTDGTHSLSKYENAYLANKSHPSGKIPLWKRFWMESGFAINETSKWAFLFYVIFSRRAVCVVMGHPKDFNDLTTENILFLGKIARLSVYGDLEEVE